MPDITTPEWHGESDYLKSNPEASKAYSKYADSDKALEGGYEAIKKVGRPFWLPDDHSNLSDEQKNEIRANVAVMEKVPLAPAGYNINMPEGKTRADEEALAELKVFAHKMKWPNEHLQGVVDYQIAFNQKQKKAVLEDQKTISKENFAQFSKENNGDTNADLKMIQIKNYLQSKCKTDDKPDPKMWEAFVERMFINDRMSELVLARALSEPAQKFAEGGAPAGSQASAVVPGAFDYAEMDKK